MSIDETARETRIDSAGASETHSRQETVREARIDYLPRDPVELSRPIGLIGAGNISGMHLAAYRDAGYNVVCICDNSIDRARGRRDEFFPSANITDDVDDLLARPDVQVVDIATHVDVRPALIERAIRAHKHVLSQKPFVKDLGVGARLINAARRAGVRLAVNQNGRWAPHFAIMLAAARDGRIGTVTSADFAVYWPHDKIVADMPAFANMRDLVLYDFGIHWFDLISRLFADRGQAHSVYAAVNSRPGQVIPVPTEAQIIITWENATATLVLRAASHRLESGSYRVEGTDGVVVHTLSLGGNDVRIVTDDSDLVIPLQGDWWQNGMHGTMAELLAAIEEGREPSNDARHSLPGLALCFAAMESSRRGVPIDPRTVVVPPED